MVVENNISIFFSFFQFFPPHIFSVFSPSTSTAGSTKKIGKEEEEVGKLRPSCNHYGNRKQLSTQHIPITNDTLRVHSWQFGWRNVLLRTSQAAKFQNRRPMVWARIRRRSMASRPTLGRQTSASQGSLRQMRVFQALKCQPHRAVFGVSQWRAWRVWHMRSCRWRNKSSEPLHKTAHLDNWPRASFC